jgi:hypothetical protein
MRSSVGAARSCSRAGAGAHDDARVLARIGGLLYLIIIVRGFLAEAFRPEPTHRASPFTPSRGEPSSNRLVATPIDLCVTTDFQRSMEMAESCLPVEMFHDSSSRP